MDYTKILLSDEIGARLLKHPALSFSGKFDHTTGEVYADHPAIAEYGPPVAIGRNNDLSDPRRALQFIVYPSGRTMLHGSMHKYAHDGANWTDYTFTQFQATIAELCRTFDFTPKEMRLLQLEAGVNVVPPFTTQETLQAIVCHREGRAFRSMRSNGGTSLGLELYRDQFGIKIYDKGFHYGLPGELLRFELKFRKGKPLQTLGIYTVNDLLNIGAWARLRKRVLSVFDEIHITEPSIDRSRLSNAEDTFVTVATVPAYWQELTKGQRCKARQKYSDIVSRYTDTPLKEALRLSIDRKLNELSNLPPLVGSVVPCSGVDPLEGDLFTH